MTRIEEIAAREKAATPSIWDESRCGICGGTTGVSEDGLWCHGCGEVDCACEPINWREKGRTLLAHLKDRDKKLAAVEKSVEEQYKDGVCLWCGWRSGGSLEFHCCWVGHFDRILQGGE